MAPQTLAAPRAVPAQLRTPDPTPDPATLALERWALVEQAQAGDAAAYGELYDALLDSVWKYIHYRIRNRQLAEDITSVVFLRGWQSIGKVTWQGKDVLAWFLTIARNAIADYRKSAVAREIMDGGNFVPEREAQTPGPEDTAVAYLSNRRLWRAVLALPSKAQRDVIVYRYGHGFNMAETAAAMGKDVNTIKALAYRATNNLRRTLAAEGMISR